MLRDCHGFARFDELGQTVLCVENSHGLHDSSLPFCPEYCHGMPLELSHRGCVSRSVPTLAEGRMNIEEISDEQLVSQIRTGDREAFTLLVERYKRGIANFIGAGVRSQADVADLTQETFLRAYAHLGTFNPDLGRFSTWLYHIARNVVRTFLGRSQRRPVAAEFGEDRTLENSVPDVSADADPMGGVLRAEAEAEVRAALADLPERTRTVLALRYYDNWTTNRSRPRWGSRSAT